MTDFLQKMFRYINRDETRKQLQVFLVDPLLNHIMERVFPYILLICVFFVILLLLSFFFLRLPGNFQCDGWNAARVFILAWICGNHRNLASDLGV